MNEPDWAKNDGPAVRCLGMEVSSTPTGRYLQSAVQKYEESGSASLGSIRTPAEESSPSADEV